MFREHVLGTIDFTECPGQDVGLMPPRFYCLGAGPMLCHGLLLLSKPAWFCGEANLFCRVISNSQFSSVAQSCSTLYDPMDCCMPGLPVHHHLLEFAQTHVHRVGDAIQPFCPLSSPSPPAFNLFQHWGLFQWVSSLHQVARVLEFQLQHLSFQWIFRTDFL